MSSKTKSFTLASQLVILIYITLAHISCAPRATKSEKYITHDSIYIEKLVAHTRESDSAQINALLRCDSLGNVYIAELHTMNDKNIKLALQLDSMGRLEQKICVEYDTIYSRNSYKHLNKLEQNNETITEQQKPNYIYKTLLGETLLIIVLLFYIYYKKR